MDVRGLFTGRSSRTTAQRQAETASFARCACGNIAGRDETQCGRCREVQESPLSELLDEFDELLASMEADYDQGVNQCAGQLEVLIAKLRSALL